MVSVFLGESPEGEMPAGWGGPKGFREAVGLDGRVGFGGKAPRGAQAIEAWNSGGVVRGLRPGAGGWWQESQGKPVSQKQSCDEMAVLEFLLRSFKWEMSFPFSAQCTLM